MSAIDEQVLIVGAGPVGLSIALRLSAWSIPCTVVEAEARLQRDLRASTFHPPTLDMLDEYGLAGPLIARGLKAASWQVRVHETHEYVEFDLGLLARDTRHPYRLQCEQFQLSELLAERLAGSPHVRFEWGTRALAVTQSDNGVTLQMQRGEEVRELTGTLLVGADGARSVVRKALGLDFAGAAYPETTILATTSFPFQDHLPGLCNVNYVWTAQGTFSLLRLPALWRCSLYAEEGESIEEAIQPGSIERKLQRIVPRAARYPVQEIRPYRVHRRLASDYRVGRIALAGDAAHLNSPSGGMGMNGGIHDAFALSAEIHAIWQGGPLDGLDRYTRRRRPIAAEEILAQADRNRARMQERDPARRRALLEELRAMAADPERARAYLLKTSMIEGLRKSAGVA